MNWLKWQTVLFLATLGVAGGWGRIFIAARPISGIRQPARPQLWQWLTDKPTKRAFATAWTLGNAPEAGGDA